MSTIEITNTGNLRISADYITKLYRAGLDAGIRNKDRILKEIIQFIIEEIKELIIAGAVPVAQFNNLRSQVHIYVTILVDELTDPNSIKPLENYKFPDDMTIN